MRMDYIQKYPMEESELPQQERIAHKFIRNVMIELLILLAVFLFDNRSYLFSYLPHASEYEKQIVRIETTMKGFYARVHVADGKETTKRGYVRYSFYERREDIIVVGYAPQRGGDIVRTSPVITSGLAVVFGAYVLGDIRAWWAIGKGERDYGDSA